MYPISNELRQKFANEETQTVRIYSANGGSKTVSGAIVTFDDGAMTPVTDLQVGITATQDLHGQANPYPSGGQLWDEVTYEGGINNSTGEFTTTAGYMRSGYIPCLPNTNYYFKFPVEMNVFFYDANHSFLGRYTNRKNEVLTSSADAYYMAFRNSTANAWATYNHDISINYPSTDTAYHPYRNICPISGHTQCDLVRCGVNLYDDTTLIHGYFPATNTDITADEAYRVVSIWLKAGTYTVSLGWSATARLIRKYLDGVITNIGMSGNTYTFTATQDGQFMLSFRREDSAVITEDINVMVNQGSTVLPYSTYNGITYTLPFGSTIYGGSLDVTTGVLTVTKGYKNMGGLNWVKNSSGLLYAPITSPAMIKTNGSDPGVVCTNYGTAPTAYPNSSTAYNSMADKTISRSYGTANPNLYVKDTDYTDASTFKTAMDGVYVVYTLASPTTVQLTAEQITTLVGQNVIYANCGDVSVTYPSSLELTNEDIMLGTFSIDRAVSTGNNLELGSCVATELTMTLLNTNGKFNNVDWSGVQMITRVGVESSAETVPMGTFYVDYTPKARDIISITALDGMCKFDKMVNPTALANWWGSRTISDIVSYCCTQCGVALSTNLSSFPNASYIPTEVPEANDLTYRQLLMYACAVMGKSGWMNYDGTLVIGFATGSSVETFDTDKRYSSDYEDYDIEITGVIFEDGETEYVQGTDDYAFDLSGNPLVQNPTTVLGNLSGLVGLTYRPFTATVVPCPHIFPMDWVSYVNGSDTYDGICTNYNFKLNGHTAVSCVGESPEDKARAVVGSTSQLIRKTVEATDVKIADALQEAKDNASMLIGQAAGGYVILNDSDNDGKPDEILVMDTPSISTATKVWRWNQNGFGYSDTGYNGTYGTAITMNGQIVADYIVTGLLKSGSGDTENSWNLNTGLLTIRNGSLDIETSTETDDKIILKKGDTTDPTVSSTEMGVRPYGFVMTRRLGSGGSSYYQNTYVSRVETAPTVADNSDYGLVVSYGEYDSNEGKYPYQTTISPIKIITDGDVYISGDLKVGNNKLSKDAMPTEWTSSTISTGTTFTCYVRMRKQANGFVEVWSVCSGSIALDQGPHHGMYFASITMKVPPGPLTGGNMHWVASVGAAPNSNLISARVHSYNALSGAIELWIWGGNTSISSTTMGINVYGFGY